MILNDRILEYRSGDQRWWSGPLIEPFRKERVQPNSYDLSVGRNFLRMENGSNFTIGDFVFPDPIDLTDPGWTIKWKGVALEYPESDRFILAPGEFALAVTEEIVSMHSDLVGRVEGKSTLGRCGLLIHATAGLIDSGFRGRITLELKNLTNRPMQITPGMAICQIVVEETHRPDDTYSGRYQDSISDWPIPPR